MSNSYQQMLEEASQEPSKELQERVLAVSDSEPLHMKMRVLFKKFFKKNTINKLRAFVEWAELRKPPHTNRTIYSQIEEYHFYEDTALVVQQDSELSCIAVSSKNQIAAVGSKKGSLLLIQSKSGAILKKEVADEKQVNALVMDDTHVFTGGDNQTIQMWDYAVKDKKVTNLTKSYLFQGHSKKILSLALSKEALLSGDSSGEIFLWNLEDKSSQRFFYAENCGVNALLFSPDCQKIFAAGDEFTIKVWNFNDLKLIRSLEGHEETVKALAVSANGELLVSGGGDKSLRLWDLKKYEKVFANEDCHEDDINCLAFLPNGKAVVSGSDDFQIKVWSTNKGTLKSTISGHTGSINCFAINTKSSLLISGSEDRTIRGWNLTQFKNYQLNGSTAPVLALASIPKTPYVISAGKEKTIRIWSIDKARMEEALDSKTSGVLSLAVNAEGSKFASGGLDGSVTLWEIDIDKFTFTKVATCKKHGEQVSALKFTKNGSNIVSGSADQTIKVWDLSLKKELREKKHPGIISSLDISPDDLTIITGTKFSGLYAWEFSTLKELKSFQGHEGEVTVVRITTSNKVVSGCQDGTIKIWDLKAGTLIRSLNLHEKAVLSLELDTDHSKIISGSEDLSLRIWDIETGNQTGISTGFIEGLSTMTIDLFGNRIISNGIGENNLKIVEFNQIKTIKILGDYIKPLSTITLSLDEKFFATGDEAGMIRIWNVAEYKNIFEVKAHVGKILKLKFTNDSKKLISCGKDNTVRIWNMEKLKLYLPKEGKPAESKPKILKNFSNSINDVALFENNKKAAFACEDTTLTFFNLETYEVIAKVNNHEGPVNCLVVNHFSNKLYSGGQDKKLLIYDLKHFEYEDELGQHDDEVNRMVLLPDNTRLISCSNDKSIKIWNVKDNKLIKTVRGHTKPVTCLAINSIGSKLYTGSEDETIQIWDTRRYKRLVVLEASSGIQDIVLNGDNTRIFSASSDPSEQAVKIWDIEDSKQYPFCEGHFKEIMRIEMTPDAKYMISCSKDFNIIIWDLKDGKQKSKLKGHNWHVTSVAITSNGSKLISCTYNANVRIWDLNKEVCIASLNIDTSSWFVTMGPEDKEFILACCDSTIRVYDIETLKLSRKFEDGHNAAVYRVYLTPDKTKMVSCGDDQLIVVWNYQQATVLQTIEGHSEKVFALAIVTTGVDLKIVSGSSDKTVRVWNLKNGRQENIIKGFPGTISDIIVTPDQKKLIMGCFGKALYAVEFTQLKKEEYEFKNMSKNEIRTFEDVDFKINDTLITPDEKTVCAAGDLTIGMWDFKTGKKQKEKKIDGFSAQITRELLSPNKKLMIFATIDDYITVWSFKKGLLLKTKYHTKEITSLLMTSNGEWIITASKDKTIAIFDLKTKKVIYRLKGHSASVNSLAMTPNGEILLSASDDNTIRAWNLKCEDIEKQKKVEFKTEEDVVLTIAMMMSDDEKKLKFLTGGKEFKVNLWEIEDIGKDSCTYTYQTMFILPDIIKELILSPDNHMLIAYLENSMMQIWDVHDFSYVNQLKMKEKNFKTMPVFLSQHNNRLMLYFDQLIDCFNGEIIFNFETNREMISFFFDFSSSSYYYITKQFELFQLEDYWFQTYIFQVLKFDSITNLNKNPAVFIRKKLSTYPFFFSFLHMAAIFEKSEYFTPEIMEHVYEGKVKLFHFFSLDIFNHTPLDILLLLKNPTLVNKYFNLFFQYFERESTTFFEKAGFLNYSFRHDYKMLNLLVDLIELAGGDDLSIISKLLDVSFIPLDESIYDNSLVFKELDFPLFVTTDSLFMTEKNFIKEKLTFILTLMGAMQPEDPEKHDEEEEPCSNEGNQSMVKAKVICLPGLCDMMNPLTKKVFGGLADCEPDNDIFSNSTLKLIANHIWFMQLRSFYLMDFIVFFFFFMLYNINYIYIYPLRTNIYYDDEEATAILDIITYILDGLLLFYSLFSLINEMRQMKESGFAGYFKSIWNYFDILTIPSLMIASVCDINRTYQDLSENTVLIVKLISATCMFCFWFRFLSYFRAISETSTMIRLIFQVITATRYFVLFMVLFMLSLACMFYLLHTDNKGEDPSFWDTVLVFYNVTVGDTSGITDYDLAITALADLFMILSAFLFAIILLNLLVSIIGDIHGDIKDSADKTRLYELVNILCDTDFSLTTQIFRKCKRVPPQGNYLVQLFNEKHEVKEVNPYEKLEKAMEDKIKAANQENEQLIIENNERIDKLNEKMEKMFESGWKKVKDYLEESRAKDKEEMEKDKMIIKK